MSAHHSSIGESEGSQDTPLRNTTPVRKRQMNLLTSPGPAKKAKTREQVNNLQGAFDSREDVKQQIESFREELRHARTEFDRQFEQVRLEYEARLSQHGKELEEKALKTKAKFIEKLNEKQQAFEQAAASAWPTQTELDNARQMGEAAAKRKIEELQQELRKARQAEELTKEKLRDRLATLERDIDAHIREYVKLQGKLQVDQKRHEELEMELREKLEKPEGLKYTYADNAVSYMEKAHDLKQEVRVSNSTLEGTAMVATMQRMQLDVARREKALLFGCLANAKSRLAKLDSEVSRLNIKVDNRERRIQNLESLLRREGRHLDTKRVLLDEKTLQVKELQDTKAKLESESHGKNHSLEKSANKTASLEILLRHADVKIDTLFKDLNDKTDRLKKESLEKASLVKSIDRLEEERLKLSQEKENLGNTLQKMDESLSRNQITIRNLQTDYDAERRCLLDQIMAETVQLHYGKGEFPKDFGYMGSDTQDVLLFQGMQGEETVLVRAQRFAKTGKAFFIIEKSDRTKIVWHESLVRCTVDLMQLECYFRLEKESNEIPIEVRIDGIDARELERWLKGS